MGDHLVVIEADSVLASSTLEADLEDFLDEHPDVGSNIRVQGIHGGFRDPEHVRETYGDGVDEE